MAYTAHQLKESIERLYGDIDVCITDLIRARLNKDAEGEGKALFKMEGLMVATEQELTCIGDYLEGKFEGGRTILRNWLCTRAGSWGERNGGQGLRAIREGVKTDEKHP